MKNKKEKSLLSWDSHFGGETGGNQQELAPGQKRPEAVDRGQCPRSRGVATVNCQWGQRELLWKGAGVMTRIKRRSQQRGGRGMTSKAGEVAGDLLVIVTGQGSRSGGLRGSWGLIYQAS